MSMNAKSAFDYVNQKYVFNPENYPAMKNLSDNEQKVFALKHTLLHMYKNIGPILYAQTAFGCKLSEGQVFNKAIEQESVGKNFRSAVVKQVVNYFKLAEILGMSSEDFAKIPLEMRDLTKTLDGTISEMIEYLTVICEKSDHTGELSNEDQQLLVHILYSSWSTILHLFQKEDVPMPYEFIPDYMKSK